MPKGGKKKAGSSNDKGWERKGKQSSGYGRGHISVVDHFNCEFTTFKIQIAIKMDNFVYFILKDAQALNLEFLGEKKKKIPNSNACNKVLLGQMVISCLACKHGNTVPRITNSASTSSFQ